MHTHTDTCRGESGAHGGDTDPPEEEYHYHSPFRSAQCVVVGFDVTSEHTFTEMGHLIAHVQRFLSDHCVLVAVGNKIDLPLRREVSTAAARAFFESYEPPIPYFETSAKTGEGVDELLNQIVGLAMEKAAEREGRSPNENSRGSKGGKKGHKGEKKKKKDGTCVVC